VRDKRGGEARILASREPSLIVRTSWVYAATGKNFSRTIARAVREREVLRVVADQVGAPTSAALIADVVASMLAAGGAARRGANSSTSSPPARQAVSVCERDRCGPEEARRHARSRPRRGDQA
jgi:dTDP-4-dehydrorhamnose reductase